MSEKQKEINGSCNVIIDEKLEQFVALAAKTGRIWVAEDVYAELQRLPVSMLMQRGLTAIIGVILNSCLPLGSMMVVDSTMLTDYHMPVSISVFKEN